MRVILIFLVVSFFSCSEKQNSSTSESSEKKEDLALNENSNSVNNKQLDSSIVDTKKAPLILVSIDSIFNIKNNGIGNIILGNDLRSLQSGDNFTVLDTILEDETTWKAKAIYYENELLALAEASWNNDSIIKRITIISPKMELKEGISIGKNIGAYKSYMSDTFPTVPDGYLILNHNEDKNISISLDINGNEKLFYGVSSLDEIPDYIKVDGIVILNKKRGAN